MYLVYVDDSQVLNNSFLDGGSDGILVSGCQDILLQNNIIKTDLRHGLETRNSKDSRVNDNIFERNAFEDIYLTSGSGNVIGTNAMLFNNDSGRAYSVNWVQAFCGDLNNSWYFGTGNLWFDRVSPDENEDGIVDRPYLIPSGCQDPFPLVSIPGLNITPDLCPLSVIGHAPQGQAVDHDSHINITFSEE